MPKRFILVFFALNGHAGRLLGPGEPIGRGLGFEEGVSLEPVIAALGFLPGGFSISHLPGSWLAYRFGGKSVLGFWASVVALHDLDAAHARGLQALRLSALRALLGLSEGINAPAIQSLVSRWFPIQEPTRVAVYRSGSQFRTSLPFRS